MPWRLAISATQQDCLRFCGHLPCPWEDFKKPKAIERVSSGEWKTCLSQPWQTLKSFLKRRSVLLTPALIRRQEKSRTAQDTAFPEDAVQKKAAFHRRTQNSEPFSTQLKQSLTLCRVKLPATKTSHSPKNHVCHIQTRTRKTKEHTPHQRLEMGETHSAEMTWKDVVKTIYISGSICFTASGAGTA